jgi:hypothetical protein
VQQQCKITWKQNGNSNKHPSNLEQLVNHKDPTKGIMDDGKTTSWADDGWKFKVIQKIVHTRLVSCNQI